MPGIHSQWLSARDFGAVRGLGRGVSLLYRVSSILPFADTFEMIAPIENALGLERVFEKYFRHSFYEFMVTAITTT